jgi:hypothetical protein
VRGLTGVGACHVCHVCCRYAPFARRVRKERAQQQEDEKALSALIVQVRKYNGRSNGRSDDDRVTGGKGGGLGRIQAPVLP